MPEGYLTIFLHAFLAIASGLVVYITLVLIRQRWVNTLHHLITYLLLPPIAFVITNVISHNLALSLGMIGALSIVRFRNPVKNPLELIIFFALLTSGISFAVNIMWGIFLTLVTVATLIFSKIFEIICKKKKLFNFSLSFDDSEHANTIEIEAKKTVDFLNDHVALVLFSHIKEPEEIYYYKLAVKDKNELDEIKNKLQTVKEIKSLEIKLLDQRL